MKFFRLIDRMDVAGRWHIGELVDEEGLAPRLLAGVPFDGKFLRGEDSVLGRGVDFSLTSFNVPVFSERLASVLTGVVGGDVQWIPIDVPNYSGYFALNALRVVDCLDELRSEFIKWTLDDVRPELVGGYRSVTRPVLDVRKIPDGLHVFRIRGWRSGLFVSDVVKGLMERSLCEGAEFVDVTP